jgi:hypothetical protein
MSRVTPLRSTVKPFRGLSRLVQFTVITANGTQLYPGRDAIPISQMVGPSYSLTIAPEQSVQGDMEFGLGPAPKLYATPAKGDLLLLWGARIRRYGTPGQLPVSEVQAPEAAGRGESNEPAANTD